MKSQQEIASCQDCRFFIGSCTNQDHELEWAVAGEIAATFCKGYSPYEFGKCPVCGMMSKEIHEHGGFVVELGKGMSIDVCSANCKAKTEAMQAINAAIAAMESVPGVG